jgi:ApbE superfamily uncharacterized protein (UPF0280 family)
MPFATGFITPMAAVAGAVADAVLAAMTTGRALRRAFVNNGGDIAFHLAPGEALRCALVTDLSQFPIVAGEGPVLTAMAGEGPVLTVMAGEGPVLTVMAGEGPPSTPFVAAKSVSRRWPAFSCHDGIGRVGRNSPYVGTRGSAPAMTVDTAQPIGTDGTFLLTADAPSRGIATSGRACKGRGGRSFSFGIADSVTVLARTAAQADAAATIVGNAADLSGHPAIDRRPADQIDPASDLGGRLVTFDVGTLTATDIDAALDAGATMADKLLRDGLIDGAVLALRGRMRIRHQVPEFA